MKHTLSIVLITLFPFIFGKIVPSANGDQNVEKEKQITTYPDHIAGAYTGGFGEQSCHSCHFDYDLNQPEGELIFSGIEDEYQAGREYKLSLTVKRKDINRAGFQMTARFGDGSQAGSFTITEELSTTPNIENRVTYLQHAVGKVEAEGVKKNWQITWKAPAERSEPVIFNIAANAANGDASEFGDWIYVKEIEVEPNNSKNQ